MPKGIKESNKGRTSITGNQNGPKGHPGDNNDLRTRANRPVSAGAGVHRGDRRDMNKVYTGNAKHAARGNSPRANVSTRKS